MSVAAKYQETITLPGAVRFPVELLPPEGFDPGRLETWPRVAGRLEYVAGRLLFMPPCGDVQQDVISDVVIALGSWVRSAHGEGFVLGSNEAGMRLGGSTRAADAAIWRRADIGLRTGGLRRHPPVLAVEVAGRDDTEAGLRDKARWYLDVGVGLVWLVLPDTRVTIVITGENETRYGMGERLPEHPSLPGLSPRVEDFFVQLAEP
jgi:Uma2 family endonuclease